MTGDLVAFVRARLDEDEQVARSTCTPPDWHQGPGDDPEWTTDEMVLMWPPEFHTPYEQDKHWRGLTADPAGLAAHIARHDPAHVLRRIARDRAVLDAYEEVADMDTDNAEPEYAYGRAVGLGYAVRQMATEHDGHPDYKTSWNSGFTQ
ncbi:DUF6221 family protein [Streptomyces sp. NPDC058603]|uniref:DUF6221 family protein n=1 Tax=Streptomyces sp. NPDC058603 TaxID=3346551 RepID=UPI00365CD83A